MTAASDERAAFAATLRAAGPDVPTLCDGWTSRDLTAHVVIRETRLDAAPGIMVPKLSGYTERVQQRYAQRSWSTLLAALESGPPWWSPMKVLDRWVNPAEMFVHHEDVRRAQEGWTPREISDDLSAALRQSVGMVGKRTLRAAPVRVRLVDESGATIVSVGPRPEVAVTGSVGELLLFCFGRDEAQVQFSGPDDAVDAVRATDRGM